MEYPISPTELKELEDKYKGKGEERGLTFKSETMYIEENEGADGLKKLEEAMASLGYPIKYHDVKFSHFYPIIIEVLTLVLIQRIFNYKDEDFEKIGKYSLKVPGVVRTLFMIQKYLLTSKSILDRLVSRVWKQYYMIGDLKIVEYELNKKVVLRVEDFMHHPLNCLMIKGGLTTLFQMATRKPTVCEEVKCMHRGDEAHEFVITWNNK